MIWQVLANGIVAGALCSLVALGYTLIYGVSRLINFSHGDVMMASAYACLLFTEQAHCSLPAGLLVAVMSGAVLSLAVERLAVRPASRTGDSLAPVISTIGASLVLQASITLIFGVQARPLPADVYLRGLRIGPVESTVAQIATLGTCLLLGLVLAWFLRYHSCGRLLRAVADDADLAETVGMDRKRAVTVAFAVSGALAGVAGVAAGVDSALRPTMGYPIGFRGFTAAVLGGLGNPAGAVLGATVVGLGGSIAGTYLSSAWVPAYVFGMLVMVLLVRPRGLLTGRH